MLRLLTYCTQAILLSSIFVSRRANTKEHACIDRLPSELFLTISEYLSNKDRVTCMCVCKLWHSRLFERVYRKVYFTSASDIKAFYNVIKHTHHTLTETVSTLQLDHLATGPIWTNFYSFQRIITLCSNIRTLELSWWQLYFLLYPTHNSFKAKDCLLQLRKLTIRSTYQVSHAVKISKQRVDITPGLQHPSLFRASKLLLESIQDMPKLDDLSVYFHRLDDPSMTEKDLEAIHSYCPSLRHLLLKNAIFAPAESFTCFEHYPVAEQIQSLTLGNIDFQDEAAFFWKYVSHKYRKATHFVMRKIRMDKDSTMSSSHTARADASSWASLHTFEFMSAIVNTTGIWEFFLAQVGRYITRLKLGGYGRGKEKKRRKMDPISVNLSWINQTCQSLKALKLSYAVLYSDYETLTVPRGQLYQRELVTYLSLERASRVEPWHIQTLNRRLM